MLSIIIVPNVGFLNFNPTKDPASLPSLVNIILNEKEASFLIITFFDTLPSS